MDKEKEKRCRDLKKNGARFFCSSSPSPSPSGSNSNNCNVRGDVHSMESCKRERAKGLKWISSDKNEVGKMDAKFNGGCGRGSEGDEGYIFRSQLDANGVSSRKRVKLQGKVLEVRGPVDHALVPRRLRSAMNKRISQSASPPLSDSKKRQQHDSNRPPLCNSSSAERFKQNMIDKVTRDEKEVAEALTSMASLITINQPVNTKEDGTMLEEIPEGKAPSSSPLEAPKDEGTKFLVLCNGGTATESSHHVENSPKTVKTDPPKLEQPMATSVSHEFDEEAKGHAQPDSLKKLASNIIPAENVSNLNDAMNISNPLGASLQYFRGNGMLQPTQLDALVDQKIEREFWPLGPTSKESDLLAFKQKPECASHDISRKGTDVNPALLNRGHEQLTMSISSKTSAQTNSVTVSGRSGSRNGLPTEKLSLMSANTKRSWNKCATHVHICLLIQSHRKADKKQPFISQSNMSTPKEGTRCGVPPSGETSGPRNGMIPPMPSASLVERSMLEARNRMLQDGRVLQAQKAAALSAAYAPQKQTHDLLSVSVASDTKCSGSGMKASGQLHVPYPPNQASMHSAFPRGSFIPQYQGQLASGAAQVQLQLPHYIASSQLHGPHMGQAAGVAPTKQQQQQLLMWQAHLAHYRPPVGFPQKWQQNGRQSDSSSSQLVSQPPSMFPFPADYNPHNLHPTFIMPMPSSLSPLPSRSKQQQQHNGGGLNPQSSLQLQMIGNTEGFR